MGLCNSWNIIFYMVTRVNIVNSLVCFCFIIIQNFRDLLPIMESLG